MQELFASGRIIDLILVLMVAEAAVLGLLYRRTGRGLPPRALVSVLLAGGFLMLALRAALTGAAWPWIGLFLGLGLVAHLADLAGRWRR
ncbi:MAG: hypothetical protein LCH95_16110 [Proteobacteria bacterium]|nr:hypothetical protein [Pseudomonadota bacterium]